VLNRRRLIKTALGAGAGLALGRWGKWGSASAFNQSPGIPLFRTELRGVGPGGIPVALPGFLGGPTKAPVTGVTHYSMGIIEFEDHGVCPTLGPTKLWGYRPATGLGGYNRPTHLSGIIVGQKGQPIQISFRNLLFVRDHLLPVDRTIMGAEGAINRTAVHLHGGLVPWISDGGPATWFDPYGHHGESFLNNKALNPLALPGSAEYYYPLSQSARFMWYHDHALGITRLNAYAGIASGLLIRDTFEAGLVNKGLPNFVEAGGNEIPLVFQDKIFVGQDIRRTDPTWPGSRAPGSLWYPHVYDPSRWDVGPGGLPLPETSIVPEFFGDTMLVNGTVFPQATVEARRYRLRLLNACGARFLNLQLYVDDGSRNGITLDAAGNPKNKPFINAATGDASFLQIGTEGGFLARPAKVPSAQPLGFVVPPDPVTGQTNPARQNLRKSLLIAPAERPDLIVDFRNYAGQSVILYADAPAPFPSGDPINDYFPGLHADSNPVNGTTRDGYGPNSRVLMRFNVVAATGATDPQLYIDTTTDLSPGIDPFLAPWGETTPPPVPTRFLTLNETFDAYGRLIQILGDEDAPGGSPYDGSANYVNPPATVRATEQRVASGAIEVWEIYNNTADVHPMHFHLVNVQVLNRQMFDPGAFPDTISFTGPVLPPDPNEVGWKETVPMFPGTVTRIIMKFDLPVIVDSKGHPVNTKGIPGIQLPIRNGVPPESPRTGGAEYVWHCHILEHEEHDMMHALVVK
jgi:spore coat protein A